MIGKVCRERISAIIVCIVCMICITVLCMSASAGGDGTIQEEPVVTLIWENSSIDVGTAEWNEHSVQINTEDIGTGNGKVREFAGAPV